MNGTGAVVLAITARAIDLAVVLSIEVDDVNVATSVMLDDLIRGMVGTTTNDVGSSITLDGNGILADILEPDKFEVAAALAVDTLTLVGTNNDVLQRSAIFKNKDSVLLACYVVSASHRTHS